MAKICTQSREKDTRSVWRGSGWGDSVRGVEGEVEEIGETAERGAGEEGGGHRVGNGRVNRGIEVWE